MTPREARAKLGLSIAEMARAMGVHRQTWTKWERRERKPDNAAAQLMRLLCWMHEKRGPTLAQWLREEAQDPHTKTPKNIEQIEDEVTKILEKTEYYESDEWRIGRMS